MVNGLTKKAEPPPTRGVNRDSGTDRANGGSGDFHEKAVKAFVKLFGGTWFKYSLADRLARRERITLPSGLAREGGP